MKKSLFLLSLVFMMLCGNINAASFVYEQTFDNPDDFPDDATVPNGWVSEGTYALHRGYATDWGYQAYSGNYVFGTTSSYAYGRDEKFYTQGFELAAGKPCTVKFYLYAPGGNPSSVRKTKVNVTAGTGQTADEQTVALGSTTDGAVSEWTQFEYTFTPDADGTYYFGFALEANIATSGIVLFDDFEISGESPDNAGTDPGTDPEVPEETKTVPFSYEQPFDNPDDFPDDATLPSGWVSEGTYALHRGAATDWGYQAYSGNYVFGTTSSYAYGRDEKFYTQGFELAAGKPCTVKFYLYAPGGNPSSVRKTKVNVTVGTGQTADEQTVALGSTTDGAVSEWTQFEYTYTPDTTGTYYFGFALEANIATSGIVLFDDFEISGESPDTTSPDPGTGGEDPGTDPEVPEGTKTVPFSYEQPFDNPDEFPDDATLPSGWVSEGTYALHRGYATDWGYQAYSGNYVFGTTSSYAYGRDEKFYTQGFDLAAGKPCTVKFYLYAPGGNPSSVRKTKINVTVGTGQTADEQTVALGSTTDGAVSEWTQFEYTYTPDTTGTYYFGFALEANIATSGIVLFDDFEISGETPDTTSTDTPDPGVEHFVVEIPYTQDFENDDEAYDGTTYVPKGWLATGRYAFITASFKDLEAQSGDYYLLSGESDSLRDEVVYTPYFTLEAGKKYETSFYIHMPGDALFGGLASTDMTLTLGKEQTQEAIVDTLKTMRGESITGWEKVTVAFTPSEDGEYCMAFNFTSKDAYAGNLAIDLFEMKLYDTVTPRANFTTDSWFDLRDSRIVVISNEPVKMKNISENATSYEWKAKGAEPSSSTEAEPTFTFPEEGVYTISLTATNGEISKTTYKEFDVELIDGETEGQMPLVSYNINDDKIVSAAGSLPMFDTDPTYDYVSGINHYYRRLAERYVLPAGEEMTLTAMSSWLSAYSRMMAYTPEERNHPFSISVYGETDGRLDESKLLGRMTSTVVDVFGNIGIGTLGQSQSFFLDENPVVLKDTFYIALEFDDNMPIDSDDPNIVRSYVALAMVKHLSETTSLYVKPTAGPNGFTPDGGWYSIDALDSDLKGYGLYLALWVTMGNTTRIVAINNDGSIMFAARSVDGQLQVSGTEAGETVSVYTLDGACVAKTAASDQLTTVPMGGTEHGVYIVKSGNKSCKVIR